MRVSRPFAQLLLASAGLAFLLHELRLPGAWLFGPLAASAFFAVRGWHAAKIPQPLYIGAQAIIGTALGAGFSPKTLGVIPQHAGIFTFAVVFILLTSLFNGWLLSRFTKLDAATSFLGTMPGGAGVMAAMSDSLGANTGLVTAVQYVRLLVILGALACVATFLKSHASAGASIAIAAPAFETWQFGGLILLAVVGWIAGMKTRIPAGAFLVPTLIYFLLNFTDISLGVWPWEFLAIAYAVMGLQIGGRFHPETIRMIRSVILPVIGTTLLLLGASLVLALVVAHLMRINLAAAYLGATPGGLDSVAAVATDLHEDTTVIVSMQLVRLLCVLIFGPWLVRLCVRGRSKPPPANEPAIPLPERH